MSYIKERTAGRRMWDKGREHHYKYNDIKLSSLGQKGRYTHENAI